MRISDWSSDVCSSDLQDARHVEGRPQRTAQAVARDDAGAAPAVGRTKPARGALSRQVACKLLQGSRGNQPAGRSGQTVFASSSSSQSKTSAPSSSSSETKLNTLRAYISLACSAPLRSEEHTSELQSLMRTSYAVFCLKKKTTNTD